MLDQHEHDRRVVHLLYYVPERRGQEFDVIEDVFPLCHVAVSVRIPCPGRKVQCVPDGEILLFNTRGDRAEFVVPRVTGHQMIALSFG